MKVLVLGCGNIGSVAVEDLASNIDSAEITIADMDKSRARNMAKSLRSSDISWIQLDASNRKTLVNALREFDLAMGFLPGRLGYNLMEACIEARKNLVDVSYMAENPLRLHKVAEEADITIVPDCGLAPGISNFVIGSAYGKLDKTEVVHVMVGGLPEEPIPPLGYTITWSPESLIDEYTREAVIVRRRRKTRVHALTGLESIEFPEVGNLEAFFTDGLRTLLHTLSDVDDMWEKTLRHPGHCEKIRLLQNLGFFNENEIQVEGGSISPRRITAKLFEQELQKPKIKDFVAMKIEVVGTRKGKRERHTYRLLDRYDTKRSITAMARTTAYPMSITAKMILNGTVKEKGVVPPERLAMTNNFFRLFKEGLEKRSIRIVEEKTKPWVR